MRTSIAIACLAGAALAAGCVGADGLQGSKGEAGPAGSVAVGPQGPEGTTGPQGADGKLGADGKNGADGTSVSQVGAVQGTVVDGDGAPVGDVAIETDPPTSKLTSDAKGAFSLKDANIGAYTLTATKKGYGVASLVFGVVSSATTTVKVTMTALPAIAAASISGLVQGPSGQALAGAKVSVDGQGLEATTAQDGTFTITDVMPGYLFLSVKSPDASKYLDGDTRSAISVAPAASVKDLKIALSGRPSDGATYIGTYLCAGCHKAYGNEHKASAHARSITPDASRLVAKNLWPSVGATVDPGVKALSPVDGLALVSVVLCQKTAGVYSMKFGGAADCAAADGTVVPVAGTYGGEGDGGVDQKPNLGVHKQQFFAKLADVPVAAGWTYTAGKDKDYLVLPVQVTQSGGGPKLEAYRAVATAKGDDGWTNRGQTFSHACAGCHVVGLTLDWEKQSGKSYITKFAYADQDLDPSHQLNIACEGCHGPGSDHFDAANGQKPDTIIRPKLLSAKAERELCGKCHGAHDGVSADPPGLGYPWNAANAAKLGGGEFFAGAFALADYIGNLDSGGVVNWPDGKHAKEHRQQGAMFELSVHANNSVERLACSNCHNPHSQANGPTKFPVADASGDTYELTSPGLGDNTVCLGCHAGFGPYASVAKADVANVLVGGGGAAKKNGAAYAPTASEIAASKAAFASSVTGHMSLKSAMSLAGYDPESAANPVGRCSSCHMPKTGKSGGFTIANNKAGVPAMVGGDAASHVFDVVQPWQGQATAKGAASPAEVMPNSCGSCHIEDRFAPN